MGPDIKVDFKADDKISKLLKSKKLNGKYGPKYGKHLCGFVGVQYWRLDRSSLELMAKKYGDIKISDAVRQFSDKQDWRSEK